MPSLLGRAQFAGMVHDRCASLDGDADRLVYFTQQDGVFQLFDGDKIAVLAALLVRDILTELPLPPQAVKVSKVADLSRNVYQGCSWCCHYA